MSGKVNPYEKFDAMVERIVGAFRRPVSFTTIQRFLDKNGWPVDEYFVRESVHRLVGESRLYYHTAFVPGDTVWGGLAEEELLVGSRPPEHSDPGVVEPVPRTVESTLELEKALLVFLANVIREYTGDYDFGDGRELLSVRYSEDSERVIFWMKDHLNEIRMLGISIDDVKEVEV